MAPWLALAVFAQFLFAVGALIDRHIVVRAVHIGNPIVYAFYVSVLSGFVIVIAPFGFVSWPSILVLGLSIASAAAFVGGLYCFYSALKTTRVSDVAPVTGALSVLTTLFLAWVFIDGDIHANAIPAVLLLALGTALISHFHFRKHALAYALLAGVSFGVAVFFGKFAYMEAGFLDGFFWTRTMALVVALSLLLVPSLRKVILHGGKHSSRGAKALVVGNKVIGSVASITMAYAVSLGSVSAVNALSGLQFAFLFIFALLFARRMPRLADSTTHGHGGWHTAIGVILIVAGFALLYLLNGGL